MEKFRTVKGPEEGEMRKQWQSPKGERRSRSGTPETGPDNDSKN